MKDDVALDKSIEYNHAVLNSERWDDFQNRSKRGEDYYCAIQTWTEQQKIAFLNQGKPCLVFNQILPIINYLTSVERDNRKDSKVVPRRGGYDSVAELATALNKYTMDQCNGDFIKSDVFLNGIRGVVGYFKLSICYDNEPVTGEIVLESRPPLAVRVDPCCTVYDINDRNGAQFVIDQQYVARDRLQSLYPDKKQELEQAIDDYLGNRNRGILKRTVDYLLGHEVYDEDNDEVLFDRDLFNQWRCRVTETYFKEYVSRTMVVDKRTFDVRWLDPKNKEQARQIEDVKILAGTHPDIFEVKDKQSMALLHKTVRVGDLLLEHVEDPFNGCSLYPIIPFSPLGQTQYDMGIVDNLVGPQDELNKRMTNAVHILNQTANGGWIAGNLADEEAKKILLEFGSSPNAVLDISKYGGTLEKIQPNQLSVGHIQLQGMDKNYMEEISGVTGSSRGYEPNRQESGRLYQQKVKQSLSTNQVIYDRFDYSVQILYTTLTEYTRRTGIFVPEEVYKIIDDEQLLTEDILEGARQQIMQQFPPTAPPDQMLLMQMSPEHQAIFMQEHLKNMEQYQQWLGPQAVELAKKKLWEQFGAYHTNKYSVKVIQSPNAPTTQMSVMYELDSMKDLIPPEILAPYMIRSSSLPKDDKDQMIERLEQMLQRPIQEGVA